MASFRHIAAYLSMRASMARASSDVQRYVEEEELAKQKK